MKRWFVGVLLTPMMMSVAQADSTMDSCILAKMATSDDTVTVGDIRQICRSEITAERKETFEPVTLPEVKRAEQQTVSLDDNDATSIKTADGSALTRRLVLEKVNQTTRLLFCRIGQTTLFSAITWPHTMKLHLKLLMPVMTMIFSHGKASSKSV